MTTSDVLPAPGVQCAWCGDVRQACGRFERSRSGGRLEPDRSHGICPACLERELLVMEGAAAVVG